ncbi:hypothetical protein [Paenibacillus thalictri]|uniref:Uncharacterized protein n=1 Tax=Paenibacillus thalictri TaxID=2527873 RepID=A0A4Q9DUD3_9BACL|nr:hypothetical protein [Paenibacillus thalictri]TBL80604.1 hypothetical protein EYB31_05080 [Paenibacillus thalictri]
MHRVLLIVMMAGIYLFAMGFEADRFMTKEVHNRLKFSLNRAAHDASLQVDAAALNDGRIQFVRSDARVVFEAGLRYNLELQSGAQLTPKEGTLLKGPVEIIYEDYVDDATPGVAFPFSYVRNAEHIAQVLKGPAVIYRVRVPLPRTNRLSYDGYIYKTVIYEYPFY